MRFDVASPGYNDGRDGRLGFDLDLSGGSMPWLGAFDSSTSGVGAAARCCAQCAAMRAAMQCSSGPLWTKVKGEPYSTQIMIDEWSFGCKNSTDTDELAQKMQGQTS